MDDQLGFPPEDDERPADQSAARPSADRPVADPTEGVRIIGADEAAEAMERGNVASRRGGGQPRFGDRPPPPPMGPRPALRFPLDAGSDRGRIERPPVQPAPDPVTGPVELPHWTDPPTGEVPQVLIGDDAPLLGETEDDLDAWSSFATSSPRWRDADDAWDEDQTEYVADLAHDDESRIGALEDPDARPTHDEFFSFDDLEEQAEERTSGSTRAASTSGDQSGSTVPPPWAAIPDAEDFHDASQPPVEVPMEDEWAEEDWEAGEVDEVPASPASRPVEVFDDPFDPDDEDDEPAEPAPAVGVFDDPLDEPTEGGAHQLDPLDDTLDELGPSGDDRRELLDEPVGISDAGNSFQERFAEPAESSDRWDEAFDDSFDEPAGTAAHWDEPFEESHQGATRVEPRRAPRSMNRTYRGGSGGGRDVRTAAIVGVVLVAVFAGLMYIGPGWAMALVTAVLFLAAVELFNALRRAGFESATLFGLVACAAFPLAVYWRGLGAFALLSALVVIGSLVWFLAGAGGRDARVVEGTGTTLLGIAWIGGLGSFAAAMLRAPDGRALLWIAVLAAVAYDVGGFFVGRNAGQRNLSEASPNKTVEGLLGGMALCIVVTAFVVGTLGLGPWSGYGPGILLGVAAAVAAPLGDLCQSLVKRDLRVKDMSAILPAHGGILDRFDGLLFVLPTIYYAVTIIGHKI